MAFFRKFSDELRDQKMLIFSATHPLLIYLCLLGFASLGMIPVETVCKIREYATVLAR